MAAITAAAVKQLRESTGLPMMDCKKALSETGGDQDAAKQWLRKRGAQVLEKRSGRETAFGRMGIYTSLDPAVGAMVELKCESAPVANSEEFIRFADDLAQQLATGPGAATGEELLDQPSLSQDGMTLGQQRDEMFNRIREVFNLGRLVRIDGPCAGYSHNAGTVSGVLVEAQGATDESPVRDICMHVAAMRPTALTVADLDADVVAKEREVLTEAARKEGKKPDNIIEKIVEGRIRNFYAESVLTEQPFVKGEKISVGEFAKQNGFELKRFVHWELGQE